MVISGTPDIDFFEKLQKLKEITAGEEQNECSQCKPHERCARFSQ